jgi:hypothetical protein
LLRGPPNAAGRSRLRTLLFFLSFAARATTGSDRPPADLWLTNKVVYPPGFLQIPVVANAFPNLRAEAIAGNLKVLWQPVQADTNATVTLWTSAEELGHWRARDWRPHPMDLQGGTWQTTVPVETLDVPVVYFVHSSARSDTNLSPMRLCQPRAVGLEAPTTLFWPFLEGFEQGFYSWRLVTTLTNMPPLRTSPLAKNGYAALAVSLPEGRRSVTIGTTRVRGWQIEQHNVTGVRLWLRTRQGAGAAKFALHANAFTTNQVVAVFPTAVPLHDQWQGVDLPFNSFPKLPLHDVDWFTIELVAPGPCEFLLDDLQYLGRWRPEPE